MIIPLFANRPSLLAAVLGYCDEAITVVVSMNLLTCSALYLERSPLYLFFRINRNKEFATRDIEMVAMAVLCEVVQVSERSLVVTVHVGVRRW